MPRPTVPAFAVAARNSTLELSSTTLQHDDDDDDSNCYEDLPPKQIWMVDNSVTSTASSVVSPLPDRLVSSPAKPKKFNSRTLIASGQIWMGGMKLHSTNAANATTRTGGSAGSSAPVLCTPDSTQTDTQDGDDDDGGGCDDDDEPVVTTLGIGAAPFYDGINHREHRRSNSDGGTSRSSISSPDQDDGDDDDVGEDDPSSDSDDLSGSIPSFSTRRIILDLQDELARTKAELALYKNSNNKNNSSVVETEIHNSNNKSTASSQELGVISVHEGQGEDESSAHVVLRPQRVGGRGNDDSSVIAVVPPEEVSKKYHTIITCASSSGKNHNKDDTDGAAAAEAAAAVLQARLHRSEQRAIKLSTRLKETNVLARRLHGTLQRVKDRMQNELLPYRYLVEDVRFMNRCATLVSFVFLIVGPTCLVGFETPDMAAFGLAVAAAFGAVEIAVRP